jgi:hypothetical protein
MLLGGFPTGVPKLWTPTVDLAAENIMEYYITVKITKVGKPRKFPLLPYLDENDGRHYSNHIVGREIVVDKIMWEDAKEFQEIEGDIICGIYFNTGGNKKIGETIRILYDNRLALKAEKKEAAQLTIKLIMNSVYGRTIMKPIATRMHFQHGTEAEIYKYINKHTVTIASHHFVRPDLCIIFRRNEIHEHWSAPHIGAYILSMSKRIMNQVMCLAEDIGADIHYQDTDSMHIDKESVPRLSEAFMEKYGKTLIGKDLGQFHGDFEEESGYEKPFSIESVFVGKKIYVDKLQMVPKPYTQRDDDDNPRYTMLKYPCRLNDELPAIDKQYKNERGHYNPEFVETIYTGPTHSIDAVILKPKKSITEIQMFEPKTKDHIRCKGVRTSCIHHYVKEHPPMDTISLYRSYLDGAETDFDMLVGGAPCFKGSKDMKTANEIKFTRRIKMNVMQLERALHEKDLLLKQ